MQTKKWLPQIRSLGGACTVGMNTLDCRKCSITSRNCLSLWIINTRTRSITSPFWHDCSGRLVSRELAHHPVQVLFPWHSPLRLKHSPLFVWSGQIAWHPVSRKYGYPVKLGILAYPYFRKYGYPAVNLGTLAADWNGSVGNTCAFSFSCAHAYLEHTEVGKE